MAEPPPGAGPFLRTVLASRGQSVAAFGAGFVAGLAEAAALALLVRAAIAVAGDEAGAGLHIGPVDLDMARSTALVGAGVATVLRLLAACALAVLVARVSTRVVNELRQRLIRAFLRAPWPVQAAEVTGEFQELLVGHMARIDQAATIVVGGLGAGGTFVALTTGAIVLAPGPALVLLVGLGLVITVTLPGLQRLAMSSGEQAAADLEVAAAGAEAAHLAGEVQVYGVEDQIERRLHRRVAEAARAQERRLRARYLLPAVSYAVVLGAAVVALATTSAIDGLDLAATGGAVLMVIRALVATQPLQESWSQAREAAPFLAAVTERIERYAGEDRDRGEGTAIQAINRIELRRAGYSYPDGTVGLDAVDLTLGPGELLGVAGPSGGGKSTLGQVLLRLRRPDTGAMLVNGGPEADLADEHWSRLVAFVPQDPLVFDGTLAENIDFFRDLPASAVQEAARSAGLSTGDLTLDRGVGPGRGTLSGGQRQRVAIARALAGGPDLIVLDEPTSALDHDTEAEVLELIGSLRSRATLVVVSHRPAPLAICDRVVHLAGGRVVD